MSRGTRMQLADARAAAEEIAETLTPYVKRMAIAGSIRRNRPVIGDLEIVCEPAFAHDEDLFGTKTPSVNMLDAYVDRLMKATAGATVEAWARAAAVVAQEGGCPPAVSIEPGAIAVYPRAVNGRQAMGPRYKRLWWHAEGWPTMAPVDLFSVIPPAQWGVILAIRTGPHEFSRQLVTQRSKGGRLPDEYAVKDGQLFQRWSSLASPRAELRTEFDVFEDQDLGVSLPCETEEEFLERIGQPWTPPEKRDYAVGLRLVTEG